MRRFSLVILILLVTLLFVGCGASQKAGNDSAPSEPGVVYDDRALSEESRTNSDGSLAGAEQRVIRTADVSLDVEQLDPALAEINRLLGVRGGYVSQSNISGPDDSRQAYLTLRLPAEHFDRILADISALGKLVYENKGGEDVTLQYVDLEARIRNMERQELRLLEVLDKAETVEDILRVEEELARVRGRLETMTAEFRYLSDRVAFATVHVSLRETPTASPTITGSGLKGVWQRARVGLVNSINGMLSGLGNLLVAFFVFLPYLILLAVLGVPAAIFIRRFGKNTPRTPES